MCRLYCSYCYLDTLRKRELKRRLREIQQSGYKSRSAADLRAMRTASMQVEEQQQRMAAAGESQEAQVARLQQVLDQAGVDLDLDRDRDLAAADDQGSASEPATAADDSVQVSSAAADQAIGLPPDAPTVTVLIKADVQGSAEAVRDAVTAAGDGKVHVKVVYCGVGPVSLTDVHLAATTGAKLIAFNTRAPAPDIEAHLRDSNVELLQHRVIYHLLDEISSVIDAAEAGAAGQSVSTVEEVVGSATVMQVFPLLQSRKEIGKVAGCRVEDGALQVNPSVVYRVLRDGEVVYEGPCSSLRQQKNDVSAVSKSNECGVVLDEGRFGSYKAGDIVQCVLQRTQRAR